MKSDFGDDVVGFDDFPRWGITCGNRRGTPILAKFAETSFRQIWRFFLRQEARSSGNAGSNISGSRLPAAATFLVTFGSQEAQYGGVLDSFRRASFPGWAFQAAVSPRLLVFFTGGSGWQMNEMMQKASAF